MTGFQYPKGGIGFGNQGLSPVYFEMFGGSFQPGRARVIPYTLLAGARFDLVLHAGITGGVKEGFIRGM
jgi:hypothetical protein